MELPVEGDKVTVSLFEYSVRLDIKGRDDLGLMIQSEYCIHSRSQKHCVDPEEQESLGSLSEIDGKLARSLLISERGFLRLELQDNTSLTVLPDPDYEAWQLYGTRGLLVVCEPGGGLAIWLPDK